MDAFEELQQSYIRDLRALLPEIETWWKNLTGVEDMKDPVSTEIMLRWPTGISGHPKVLGIFQKYFFELDDINEACVEGALTEHKALTQQTIDELAWGNYRDFLSTQFQKPVDVLINQIEDKAPDLAKLVLGIIMVPVGVDPEEEYF